jgi:hypothetical protein
MSLSQELIRHIYVLVAIAVISNRQHCVSDCERGQALRAVSVKMHEILPLNEFPWWKTYFATMKDKIGENPLLPYAVYIKKWEFVRYLMRYGVSIDQKTPKGNTALLIATDENVTRSLLALNADPAVENKDGHNSLTLALSSGSLDTTKVLIEYDKDNKWINRIGQKSRKLLILLMRSFAQDKQALAYEERVLVVGHLEERLKVPSD